MKLSFKKQQLEFFDKVVSLKLLYLKRYSGFRECLQFVMEIIRSCSFFFKIDSIFKVDEILIFFTAFLKTFMYCQSFYVDANY